MSPQDQYLAVFSLLFMGTMALFILVPYLLRRSDLLTFMNLFLAGSFLFVGMSAWFASRTVHLDTYDPEVYTLTYIGFTLFYAVLFLTYYFVKFPRKLAGKLFRTWPMLSRNAYLVLAAITMLLSLIALLPIPIPLIGQLIFRVMVTLGPFSVVMAIMAFGKDTFNPITLVLLIVAIGGALALSVAFGGGRRFAISLVFAIPVVIYWTWLRYRKPKLVLPALLLLGLFVFGLNNGLEAVRHQTQGSGFGRAMKVLKAVATQSFSLRVDKLQGTAQDAFEVSLYTVHLFSGPDAKYDTEILAAPYFMLVSWVPRTWWEDKPKIFGYVLPMEIGKKEGLRHYKYVTWGIPPAAQGFHDGGLIVIVIYGFGIGILLRYLDEWLIRQPNNPFLLGFLASSSANFIGLPRGSIENMLMPTVAIAAAFFLLAILARMMFGSGYVYPQTSHILQFPRDYLKP